MAEIRSYWLWRQLRAEPTNWIVFYKNGKKRKSERGAAFWFAPLGASLVEVPLDDRELPFIVQARSADFQDVHVNGVVTFRVRDAELLASRLSFSIDTRSGRWTSEPLDKLAVVVEELAQELAGSFVARAPLRVLLDQGIDVIRDHIQRGLVAAPSISSLGVEIVATRVASVKPAAEMEKALQMPTREKIQQEADEATFGRRALAVEKERAIAENELANQIELAKREEQLIGQRGQNEKKRACCSDPCRMSSSSRSLGRDTTTTRGGSAFCLGGSADIIFRSPACAPAPPARVPGATPAGRATGSGAESTAACPPARAPPAPSAPPAAARGRCPCARARR